MRRIEFGRGRLGRLRPLHHVRQRRQDFRSDERSVRANQGLARMRGNVGKRKNSLPRMEGVRAAPGNAIIAAQFMEPNFVSRRETGQIAQRIPGELVMRTLLPGGISRLHGARGRRKNQNNQGGMKND